MDPNFYVYSPLNEASHEIRLLTLHPGGFSSPIRVSLSCTPFTDVSVPEFEALSYTWGPPENPRRIFIGATGEDVLEVTQNLAEALPYLRYEDRPRILWIDAICVNQKDQDERSSQVQRMAQIYSKTRRVVVWLGPEANSSSIAIECFEKIASSVEVNWLTQTMRSLSGEDASWADKGQAPPFSDGELRAISDFLGRSWFERLWIWQEVRLAPRDTLVICGFQSITWQSIKTAIYCMHFKPLLADGNAETLRGRISAVYQLCFGVSDRLYAALVATKKCECTDPRDRIYALLSLLQIAENSDGIRPNYRKSALEVWKDALEWDIKSTGKLAIITTVEMTPYHEREPSWMPNWTGSRASRELAWRYASGGSEATAVFSADNQLQVTGLIVDTIEIAADTSLSSSGASMMQMVAVLRRVASTLGILNSGTERLYSLCKVLVSDDLNLFVAATSGFYVWNFGKYNIGDSYSSIQSNAIALNIAFDELSRFESPELTDPEFSRFLNLAIYYSYRRCIFVTKSGRLGLGPRSAKRGDVVTVVLGCPSAMILRPSGENQFRVVGEACVDGVMDGEALLGPLPEPFELIKRYGADTRDFWFNFRDRKTGAIRVEDPRLKDELPAGWERKSYWTWFWEWIQGKSHPQAKYWTSFVNTESGEELIDGKDPRMSSEALKERGVDLQVLTLV
jgi:hypothetical protein